MIARLFHRVPRINVLLLAIMLGLSGRIVTLDTREAAADFSCCGKWITERGSSGLCRLENCCDLMGSRLPNDRLKICKDLKAQGALCPNAAPYCAIDCDSRAKSLRDELRAINNAIVLKEREIQQWMNVAHSDDMDWLHKELDWLKRKKELLRQEWAELKRVCPDIGSAESDVPDSPSTSPLPQALDAKSTEGKKRIHELARRAESEAGQLEVDAVQIEVACSALPTVAIEGEGGIGVHYDLSRLCSGPTTAAHAVKAQVKKEEATALRDLADDPPSTAFKEVAVPRVTLKAPGQLQTDIDRQAWEAVIASKWTNAYIAAFRTSYERYQGAKAAGDSASMDRQALAMVRFAVSAGTSTQTATQKWYGFELAVHSVIEKTFDALKAKGQSWQGQFAKVQQKLTQQGLSRDLTATLSAMGFSKVDLDAYLKRQKALTTADVQRRLTVSKSQTAGDESVRAQLGSDRDAWPQPSDLSLFRRMELDARRLAGN